MSLSLISGDDSEPLGVIVERPGMRLSIGDKAYDFHFPKLMNVEAIAIEDKAGLTLGELGRGLKVGSTRATTACLWIMRKREEPTLRFTDVTYPMDQLTVTAICESGHVLNTRESPLRCLDCGEDTGKEERPDTIEGLNT